jgi:hypothetical protein
LCRYGARPPFSLERLSMLADGRVAYLRCMPRRNGATHLVMTPVQLSIAATVGRIRAALAVARCPGAEWAGGESRRDADLAARQEEADADAAAISASGMGPRSALCEATNGCQCRLRMPSRATF